MVRYGGGIANAVTDIQRDFFIFKSRQFFPDDSRMADLANGYSAYSSDNLCNALVPLQMTTLWWWRNSKKAKKNSSGRSKTIRYATRPQRKFWTSPRTTRTPEPESAAGIPPAGTTSSGSLNICRWQNELPGSHICAFILGS